MDITKTKVYETLPTVKSTDLEWLKWIKLTSNRYGTQDGRKLFLQLWTKRGSDLANTLLLRRTLKKDYDIEIDETVWNKIVDLGGGIGDAFGTLFKAGKVLTYVVGAVAVLTLVIVVRNAIQGNTVKIAK